LHRLQNLGRSARASNRLSSAHAPDKPTPTTSVCVGRFAPSPSGDLHLGSLVAAVASAADAKHQQGQHRVRIDDIDPPREVAGAADRIVAALHRFKVPIDAVPMQQSERINHYQQALRDLIELGHVFACACSRKALHQGQTCSHSCRQQPLANTAPIEQLLQATHHKAALRLDLSHTRLPASIAIVDRIQTAQTIYPAEVTATPVLWRKDGYVSYLLATICGRKHPCSNY